MSREPVATFFFALAVVRKGPLFLLVHEQKHGQLWYLPAGRVEPGEQIWEAAIRETREEAGIPIALDGIIRFEHLPDPDFSRVRVIFLAHPTGETPLKTRPDEDSLGAAWVSLAGLKNYPLRGAEVEELFRYVAGGGFICPLDMLALEGSPVRPAVGRVANSPHPPEKGVQP